MHPNDKRAWLERYERLQRKHHKTREEELRLREEARARRAGGRRRSSRRRRRDDDDEDDAVELERMKSGRRPRAGDEAPAVPRSPLALSPTARLARVVAVHRTRLVARAEDGARETLDLRPPREPVVVGDGVWIEGAPGPAPQIVALEPRRSLLARAAGADWTGRPIGRPIAANVDVGVVVAALREPALRPGLVERLLVALAAGGIEPLVALAKADLVPEGTQRTAALATLASLSAAEAAHVFVSARTGEGLDALRARLAGRTCVLVGHSGVGKSSLLNALVPAAARPTGAVRAFDGKGRHTTASSELVELPDGTRIVDTPGVRAFGIAGADTATLAAAFPEVAALAARCRFGDCRHADEPGCAVRAAVLAGTLPAERLAAWLRLRDEAV